MARNDNREQELLNQYWDADPAGRRHIPADLDESLRQTVDEFHQEDDTPDPDPAFVAQLWSEIAGAASVQSGATAATSWSEDAGDESTTPQYIPEREENEMQTQQQSAWRRRARQIGELVAGVAALVLITGALIFAYQNLVGERNGDAPGAGDEIIEITPAPTPERDEPDNALDDRVPELAPLGIIGQHGDLLHGTELGPIQIGRHEGQNYAFLLTFPMSEDGEQVFPTIQILRLDDGRQPEPIGSVQLDSSWSGPMQFNMGQMALVDGVLYTPMPLESQPGIWVVDVSDPENPQELAFLDIEADWPMTLVAADDVAVATGMFGNIYFFLDISNPAEPVLASQLTSEELELHAVVETLSLSLDGDTLSIAHPRGLTMLDVSDPTQPEALGAIENPDWEGPQSVEGAGTDTQIELSVGDAMLNRAIDPAAWHDSVVVGDHAYVAAGDGGVLVFDVSDQSNPREAGTVELKNRTFRLTEANGFLYALGVSSEGNDDEQQQQPVWAWSVDVLELDDPAEPGIAFHLDDLLPPDAPNGAANFFLMTTIRQAVAGEDFYLAWGRGGMYVAATAGDRD